MRLIDADKLLELMKDQKEREIGAYTQGINAGLNILKSIINDETQTPTAYDVDKVVERLEELKSKVPVNRILDDIIKDKPKELGQLIAYNKAIEIVKAGAKYDD